MKQITNKESRHALLHASLIEGIGAQTLRFLFSLFDDPYDYVQMYTWKMSDWREKGFSETKSRLLLQAFSTTEILEKELKEMNLQSVRLVLEGDDEYPVLMKGSQHLPCLLYVYDDPAVSAWYKKEKFLAGVSSRQATDYTYRAAQHFFKELFEVCVVSGGAIGGDAFIHQAALEHDLPTVAVIGSGLCRLYPAQNRRLFEKIVKKGGAVISPFGMSVRPSPGTFPARNQIIAGMSHATVVFQGMKKSGTLITAQSALEQGREVGAVPGLFDSQLSQGCHWLLSQGATLIQDGGDVRQLLQLPEKVLTEKTNGKKSLQVQSQILDEFEKIFCSPHTAYEAAQKLSCDVMLVQKRVFEYAAKGKMTQDIMGRWQLLDF